MPDQHAEKLDDGLERYIRVCKQLYLRTEAKIVRSNSSFDSGGTPTQ